MSSLVEKGNKISVELDVKEKTIIKWQQNFQDRQEVFFAIPYYVVDNSEASGTLFVEKKLFKDFKNTVTKDEDDDTITTVTDDFQYGQDKDKTLRFLVYHDKKENMFQHRFVTTNAFQKISEKAAIHAGKVESVKKVLDKVTKLGKAYIGDKLKNF